MDGSHWYGYHRGTGGRWYEFTVSEKEADFRRQGCGDDETEVDGGESGPEEEVAAVSGVYVD